MSILLILLTILKILFAIAILFLVFLIMILYIEGYHNKKDWDFIDKVIYINLENRKDRREQIENELSKIPSDKIIRLDAVYDEHGHLGCSQSHIKALEMAIEGQWKNVLIVEDDAMWNSYDKGYKRLNELIKQNPAYDVITLGNVGASFDKTTGRLESAQTATAYLVNNHYFHILHDNFVTGYKELSKIRNMSYGDENNKRSLYEQKYCVDQYWKLLQSRDNWYIVNPALMIQRPSKSSIAGGVDVDYTSYFNL
jgi:glycosyl transferase family 25